MSVVREPGKDPSQGRLSLDRELASKPGPTGLRTLDGGGGALAFVPQLGDRGAYRLVVLLHGAGGSARQGLGLMQSVAGQHGLLLVAPQSVAASWDLISGGYGPDVRRLNQVLTEVLASYPVTRTAIGGFSDGASYALSLGMTNGDVFDAVLAFSPGFAAPLVKHGSPRIFVSHGEADRVLPIDRCSRQVVPRLRRLGYEVTYDEFPGGHEVPAGIVTRACNWLEEDRTP